MSQEPLLILYVQEAVPQHDADGPIGERITFRPATLEEIGATARALEVEIMGELIEGNCIPIPVRVTWAGHSRVDAELHSRTDCDHVWKRGTPRVHIDTTREIYVIGQGELVRGELEDG